MNYTNEYQETSVGHLFAAFDDAEMFTKLVPDNAFAFTCGRGCVFHRDADVGMPLLEDADEEEEDDEDEEEEDEGRWKVGSCFGVVVEAAPSLGTR